MTRIQKALITLALTLAFVTATAAAAVATPPTGSPADQRDRLRQGIAAGQAQRTQAAVEQARALERQSGTAARAATAAPVEDQNDRLLRGIEAAQAGRTRTAVEQARAGERKLVPVVTVTAPQPLPTAPARDVDVVAIALLGLVGGLVGGAAVVAGTAANRRRHRIVAA